MLPFSAHLFSEQLEFDPSDPAASLTRLPPRAAVFSLRGATGEPYLNRTSDLRRRVTRLLTPAPAQSKRLQLAALVRKIAWVETASEFSAQWCLYRAALAAFGTRASKRLHLRNPYFVRMGMHNRFPRLWVTNSITSAAASDLFGPFPSRNAADRYTEQVLDLFLLRRCFPDLEPDPEFPGCIYSEMKKCLAPCYGGCSEARYDEEARAVHAFLATRGDSLLTAIAQERDRASEALDFEGAAAAHARYGKVESVTTAVPELAHALATQYGVLVQPSIQPDHVDLYLLHRGIFAGPVQFSVLGMRLPNEQSGSSSLFAHPAALLPVPLGPIDPEGADLQTPDERLRKTLEALEAGSAPPSKQELCDHQALLARWYFRPQTKRDGELVLAPPTESTTRLPSLRKTLLRAIARVYRAHVERTAPAAGTDTEPAADAQ
jgi:excinuclease ABC subunit C